MTAAQKQSNVSLSSQAISFLPILQQQQGVLSSDSSARDVGVDPGAWGQTVGAPAGQTTSAQTH